MSDYLLPGGLPAKVMYKDDTVITGTTVEVDPDKKALSGVPMIEEIVRSNYGAWIDVSEAPDGLQTGIYFFFTQDIRPSEVAPEELKEIFPDNVLDMPLETAGRVWLQDNRGGWWSLSEWIGEHAGIGNG